MTIPDLHEILWLEPWQTISDSYAQNAAKELHRETRSFIWLEDARRDVRYAVRRSSRHPGFPMTAILSLLLRH